MVSEINEVYLFYFFGWGIFSEISYLFSTLMTIESSCRSPYCRVYNSIRGNIEIRGLCSNPVFTYFVRLNLCYWWR